jgi:hypothetical protein
MGMRKENKSQHVTQAHRNTLTRRRDQRASHSDAHSGAAGQAVVDPRDGPRCRHKAHTEEVPPAVGLAIKAKKQRSKEARCCHVLGYSSGLKPVNLNHFRQARAVGADRSHTFPISTEVILASPQPSLSLSLTPHSLTRQCHVLTEHPGRQCHWRTPFGCSVFSPKFFSPSSPQAPGGCHAGELLSLGSWSHRSTSFTFDDAQHLR